MKSRTWVLDTFTERPALKYKRAFIDWRAVDRLKRQVLHRADFILDTNDRAMAKMIAASDLFDGLKKAANRPSSTPASAL
jgi:hypothetical protein